MSRPFFARPWAYRRKKKKDATPEIATEPKKTTKKKNKKKRASKPKYALPERPAFQEGRVCSCDPGLRTLSFAVARAPEHEFEYFVAFDVANDEVSEDDASSSGKEKKKKGVEKPKKQTWESMKDAFGDGFWNEVMMRVHRFLDARSGAFEGVRELLVENQIGHDELAVASMISSYFKIRHPGCDVVSLPRNSAGALFRIDKNSREDKTNAHSKNKAQATMFVVRNQRLLRYADNRTRRYSVKTNHFCDCVVNYAYAYLRTSVGFEKGPFVYRDLKKEKRVVLELYSSDRGVQGSLFSPSVVKKEKEEETEEEEEEDENVCFLDLTWLSAGKTQQKTLP